jgi:hypothetical protein
VVDGEHLPGAREPGLDLVGYQHNAMLVAQLAQPGHRLGLDDVPIATNANALRGGGAGVSFPYGHPVCHVCGTCKRERVRAHQAAGNVVVFVGDGPRTISPPVVTLFCLPGSQSP